MACLGITYFQKRAERIVRPREKKFAIGVGLIIVVVLYLAYSQYEQSSSYSHTLRELYAMKESAYGVRLQVVGTVVPRSIKRQRGIVTFVIRENPQTLRVR